MTAPGGRQALLVLGMHRGGTSALARAALLAGAAGPATLMAPAADNPGGFWESAPVVALNDALLAAGGSRWDDWWRFETPGQAVADARIADLLRVEFGEAALFVLKDPRLARMLPPWLRALEAEGIAPSALIALRHPGAVARSLARRNRMRPNHAALLWLRHMLDAEYGTRAMPRALVRFGALLRDWRAALTAAGPLLGIAWSWRDAAGAVDFPDRRPPDDEAGHETGPEAGSVYAEVWCRHAWQALCALEAGDEAGMAVLDRVRAQFDDACGLFASTRPSPDPRPDPRPDLRSVTLCAADSARLPLTLRGLAHSATLCEFGDAMLFTDADVAAPVRVRRIPRLDSRDAYSAFLLKGLADHVATPHVLVVQWDGFVVAPEAWDPAFLACDYIGARWEPRGDGMDVGNGGFSLRSRRLLDALRDARFQPVAGVPEDHLIGRVWRPVLEREYGIRFAAHDLADRFAQERVLSPVACFGFHGLFNFWRHFDDAALAGIVASLPPDVREGREFAELAALRQRSAGRSGSGLDARAGG